MTTKVTLLSLLLACAGLTAFAAPFIIPQPTTGVAIDGQYKDWGYENVLYIWTPPAFVKLDNAPQLVSGAATWKGPTQLSGSFSLMMDDKNLYFLAVAADATPFGGSGLNAWENDSVELFLAFDVGEREISATTPTQLQISYDCRDASGAATVINAAGKSQPDTIKTKIIPQEVLVDGKQCHGYVLESAIPLASLPIKKREKGMPVAFSIKLNDSASRATLSATPSNKNPHANIAGFKRSCVELETEGGKAVKFGNAAANVFWPVQYADAKGRRVWDMVGAWTDASRNHIIKRLCLNSLWAVQCVDTGSASPNPAKWVYAPCPMGIGWGMPGFVPSKDGVDSLSKEVNGLGLLGGIAKKFFWYERTFSAPPATEDALAYLDFEHLDKEADVYVNKAFAGTVSLLSNRLDISKLLKQGQPNRLDLLLYTQVKAGYSCGNGNCGITGDIYLELRKTPPVLEDVWVKRASGLDGSFEVEVKSAKGPAREIQVELCGKDGKSLLRLSVPSTGGVDTIRGKLKDFRPWSPDSPALYTLNTAALENGVIVDERNVCFGFRTFELKDARFMLNGKLLRLRAFSPETGAQTMAPGEFAKFKENGYNCLYSHSMDSSWKEPLFDKADAEGFVTFAPLFPAWPDELTAKMVSLYRNHPSVIGYVSDPYGQLSANGFSYNPFAMADDYYPESESAKKTYSQLLARRDFFKTLDPTRPYISQGTGNLEGSLKNTHHYPTYDFTMVDRLQFYQPWAERRKPLCPQYVYECGVYGLHDMDNTHPECKFTVSDGKKSNEVARLLTREAASRFLGPQAFENWRLWDVMEMKAGLRGLRSAGIDGFTPWVEGIKFLALANTQKAEDIPDHRQRASKDVLTPFRQSIEDSWMRQNSWHYSLRAQAFWQWPERYGQGEIKETPSIFTPIFLNEMQPFCAFVGGRSDMIHSQEHNYYSGEDVAKTIVAVNDTEDSLRLEFTATLSAGGKETNQTIKADIAQGGIVNLPLSFIAPDVKAKTPGQIKLVWTMPDGKRRQDVLDLTIFPRYQNELAVPTAMKIGVVPSPYGGSLVAQLGLPFAKLDAATAFASGVDLLVFERGAFVKNIDPIVLRRFLDQGGRLLVMEQNDSSLLDWRLRERRLETLFPAVSGHPALKGLDAADLSFLRGPDDLIPAEHRPAVHYRHGLSAAMETPHLSNEGITAAYVLDKPSFGSFLPLLVGGYDLEETALLEIRSGKGLAMFCQVDISGRYGQDPAATLLARNIFAYMLQPPAPPPAAALYLGGPKGAALLDRIGAKYVRQDSPSRQTLLLGEDATIDKETLAKFQTVVILPGANYLQEGVTASPVVVRRLDYPQFWHLQAYGQFDMLKSILPTADRPLGEVPPEFAGIVANDLYYFESPELKAYRGDKLLWHSEFSTLALSRQGAAKVVLCSVDPDKMKSGETKKKAYRVWSLILANLRVANAFEPSWQAPAFDLSDNAWTLLTDPDGSGEKTGFQNGKFGGRVPRPIRVGAVWEEQGVNDANPNLRNPPDSQYDGFAWYFTKAFIPADTKDGKIYLHADGVKDIPTYNRTDNQTDLFLNGVKVPPPERVYNAYLGGCGARLWAFDTKLLKKGQDNFIAIRVFNSIGPAGLFRKPVRFERDGQNPDMLLPYEFMESKYNPYFFWSW